MPPGPQWLSEAIKPVLLALDTLYSLIFQRYQFLESMRLKNQDGGWGGENNMPFPFPLFLSFCFLSPLPSSTAVSLGQFGLAVLLAGWFSPL